VDAADEREREDVVDAGMGGSSDRRPRRRYKDIAGGLGAVLLLVAGILGVAAWHMGWFARDASPRTLDRRPPATPAPRSEVAPSPVPPSEAAPVAADPSRVVPPAMAVSSPIPPVAPRTVPAAATRETAAGEAAAGGNSVTEVPAVAQGPRFAVEFGPFLTGVEAEKTERSLNRAGHQTVRFRQQTGAALYAVLIERVPGPREAQAVVAALREGGFPDGDVNGNGDALTVRVGEPMLLRAAVQLAESLRAKGHQVRVAAQSGEAQTFVIRHGNFASREEAEARGAELGRLGLVNHVVRAK
jgi:hypothetical protein